MSVDYPIPRALNIVLAIGAGATAVLLLKLASTAPTLVHLALYATGFSFVNNTLFSLLHEAVHGMFNPNKSVNDAMGVVLAAFFPTGFSIQRTSHLGHHQRNRTDEELFDYVLPGESRLLKAYRLYSLLTGFYWLSIPVGCLWYLIVWNFPRNRWVLHVTGPMGMNPMVKGLEGAPPVRARVEVVVSLLFQLALIYALELTWLGWWVCYWAFALNWCALQYTDHAWTVRDIRNGASNLRVTRPVQYLFLNYHHHLAHHQHPRMPWIHLHRLVDFSHPRPSFIRTYLSLWAGPRLTLEPAPKRIDPQLERELNG